MAGGQAIGQAVSGIAQLVGQNVGVIVANRQRLGLSAQMRQQLQLLQMPSVDLAKFVASEMEHNPLLAIASHKGAGVGAETAGLNAQDFSITELLDRQGAYLPPTLHSHVREQIIFSFSKSQEQRIAFYLSDGLDDSGYFEGELAGCARQFGVKVELVRQIFSRLQNFDPPGLFARSLAECMEIQLKRQGMFDPAFAQLLQHLPLLARRDFSRLAQLTGLGLDELMRRIELIQRLEPKPGLAFASSYQNMDNPVIIADAFIDVEAQGGYHVELNDATLPKLILDQNYSQIVGANGQEQQFIKNCLAHARWLIRALDARAETLLKVISAIMAVQKDFLLPQTVADPCALKPLTLAQIAAATGLHESTISRTIANKYVMIRQNGSRHALHALRYFFSTALASLSGNESHAARAIEARIARLIATEATPLSDASLAQLLKQQGIVIARRTVTKYRERLRIAPSYQRRHIRGRHQ